MVEPALGGTIHDQSAGLASEYPVDSRNRLHQSMRPHVLVQIHGVETRNIKASEPHIHHNGYLKIRFRIFKLAIQLFAVIIISQQVI